MFPPFTRGPNKRQHISFCLFDSSASSLLRLKRWHFCFLKPPWGGQANFEFSRYKVGGKMFPPSPRGLIKGSSCVQLIACMTVVPVFVMPKKVAPVFRSPLGAARLCLNFFPHLFGRGADFVCYTIKVGSAVHEVPKRGQPGEVCIANVLPV